MNPYPIRKEASCYGVQLGSNMESIDINFNYYWYHILSSLLLIETLMLGRREYLLIICEIIKGNDYLMVAHNLQMILFVAG